MSQIRVSKYIGNAYLDWEPGHKILISSPTGSGKTHFAINTFSITSSPFQATQTHGNTTKEITATTK